MNDSSRLKTSLMPNRESIYFSFLVLSTFAIPFFGIYISESLKIADILIFISFFILCYLFLAGYRINKTIDLSCIIVSLMLLLVSYISRLFCGEYLILDTKEMIKAFLSTYVLMIFYIIAVKNNQQFINLVVAFVLSVCLNAFLGILETEGYNIIDIFHSQSITGGYSLTGRAEGLTMHSNFLGILCAMTVPIVICLDVHIFKYSIAKILSLILLLNGVIISGSRSALAATFIVSGLIIIYTNRLNIKKITIFLLISASAYLLISLNTNESSGNTSAISRIIEPSNQTSSESNEERIAIMAAAIENINKNPIIGNGMRYIQHAHCIYVQFIESAGIFGLLSLVSYITFFVIGGYKFIQKRDILGIGLSGSVLTFFANGLFSNIVYTRPILIPLYMFAIYLNLGKRRFYEL